MNVTRSLEQFFQTRQLNAYIGGFAIAAAAGQNGHVQLWNPNGSGRILVVRRIYAGGGTSNLALGYNNAVIGVKQMDGFNKFLTSAVGVGDVYSGNAGVIAGTTIAYFYQRTNGPSGELPINDNIIIPQNLGLHVAPTTQNIGTSVTFEWIEIPV